MSISKIEKLRKERQRLVDQYETEKQRIKEDGRFTESYRQEKIDDVNKELADVRNGHDAEIRRLIREGKNESMDKLDRAEFDVLDEKGLLKKMTIDNRNYQIEQRLTEKYKDDVDSLKELAEKEVNARSMSAPAYINALKRVNDDVFLLPQITALENTHKENSMNSLQKDYYKDLQAYEQQEEEYQQETQRESFVEALGIDAFQATGTK